MLVRNIQSELLNFEGNVQVKSPLDQNTIFENSLISFTQVCMGKIA